MQIELSCIMDTCILMNLFFQRREVGGRGRAARGGAGRRDAPLPRRGAAAGRGRAGGDGREQPAPRAAGRGARAARAGPRGAGRS